MAVPAVDPVADKVCAIVAPVAAEAPLTPDCVTVHANAAPAVLLVNAIELALPEQIV